MRSPYLRGTGGPLRTVGHRGALALAPENTIAAMEAGLRCGVDAVEFDVQRTRDGTPIVIHDETLERTTNGAGRVREHNHGDIRALDAGGHFDPRFAGERVPTLADLLAWAAPRRIDLVLELKQPVETARDGGLAAAAVDAVHAYELLERTLFISFDHPSLVEVLALEPSARTAALIDSSAVADPLAAARAVPDAMGLHVQAGLVSKPLCDAAHRLGMHIHSWGLGGTLERGELARLVACGTDSVSADDPCELIAALRALGLR